MAVHSQTMVLPGCPTGWEEMWMGYSFLMASFFYKFRIFGFDFYEHLFSFLASSWIKCKFFFKFVTSAHRLWCARQRSVADFAWIVFGGIPRSSLHRVPRPRQVQLLLDRLLVLARHLGRHGHVQKVSTVHAHTSEIVPLNVFS